MKRATLNRGQRLQHRFQQVPAMAHRCYLHLFTGRMCTSYIGAEGNHVKMRMTGGEQAAFKSGVDHLQAGGLAEFFDVHLLAQRQHAGSRFGVQPG